MKRDQKGFGAIEGMLLIIIILLVGFIGYYVYRTKNNTNSTYNNAAKSASSYPSATTSKSNTQTDKELIAAAITKDCDSTIQSKVSDINVYKYEGDYAAATYACINSKDGSNPTSRVYLKKSAGTWSIVVKGGGAPTTIEELQPFGFPSKFLD